MKGKTKKIIRSIGKKILAISTSAVLAFTTVMSTMPTLIHANDNEVKIARDEVTNITVKSIASYDQYTDLEHLMDNDIDSYMDSDYSNHNNDNLQWYQFELNEEVNVSRVRIHPRKGSPNGRPNSYKIYAGTDADNLGLITEGSIDPTIEDWTDITFEPVTARFVKVELTTAEDNFLTYHVITAAEVELYKSETEPEQAVEEAYATEGYQDADGYVYLKLNGKPEKITSVGFVITEIDGEYYAVSDEPVSALTYGGVCLAGSTDKRIWSHFYVNEDGTEDVCTEYNLQDPTIYIKVGDERVNINTKEDYSITIPETFTDVPYVHVESVDISQVTVLHAIPSEEVLNIEVTGNHQSVDIPLINKSAQEPKSGLFAVSFHYASNGSKYFEITVNYDDSCVEARTTLDNIIKEAEALNETDYTAESWKTLQDAVTAGKEVADNNIATKDVITNASNTISTAIENLVEEVKVDKSKLADMITKYGNFTSDHSTYSTFQKTLTQARNALDDSAVTQDRVDYLTRNLEAHYYLVLVAEYNSKYAYDKFDYSQYKTETVIPVIRMLGITRYRTNGNYSENAENKGQMKGWYEEYQKAIEGLEKATDEDKLIGFNPESDSSSEYQGNFTIISEEVVDGKIKLTVRFDNDGLHPIYGKSRPDANGETEYEGFPPSAMAKPKATVYIWDENFKLVSSSSFDEYQKFEGVNNYYKGFIATKEINNARAKYITFRYYEDSFTESQSPWYYKLDDLVDTFKLQTLVDEVSGYERNTGVYKNEFKPAFEKAEEILSNQSSATQEEVDKAYATLDKAYARCQIQDYILDYYYRPYEKYADYTTDSALTLYHALGSAQTILDEITLTTDELKAYIKELDEKKAALVKVEEGTVKVEKGINKDAADNENNVGFFTVTEEANGDKVILHVEYHNDGINHLTNEELATLDFTNIKNYRIVIENRYYDKEENGSSSSTRNVNAEEFKPLNGETDYSKGFQFDYEVDPGNIKIRLKDLKQNEFIVYSLGTYLTDEEKNAPEALKIKKLDDGTVRVEFSEPVEIEDANWKKSDKAGERDGSVWIGTLTEDKFYEVAAKDLPGNSMTFTVDHKTPVVKSISYSETELTNKDVKVAINFDEYISVANTQLNPGWKYDVKHLKATKTFSENTTEDVTFVDKTGNKVTVTVTVNNIDKTVPEVEVSYSNDNGNQVTRDDVTVTLTANEAIKDIEGWERTSENVLTKVFSENGKHAVDVYDLAGNKTTVNFEVKRIDRIDPVITLHGVEPDGITKDKVTYTITEQSISKIVIDGVEYNEKNAPKEISGVGKHTIRVIDKAGNEASVSFTIVESVNPTVTVKDSSKGTEGHYSYLDLKLYDASGIDYVVVNDVKKDLTNNAWSDLNDVNVNYVEGHNVVEVYDIYGNKTVFEFDYDTTAPVIFAENITIKKGSTFDPLQGVKAIDNGKDITTSIVVEENNVNTRRTGKYEVRYSVTDLAGNTTEKTIIVTVEKKSCWENIVDIVEDTIKVVEDIVHGILDWIF